MVIMLQSKNTFEKVCIYFYDQAANFSIHSRIYGPSKRSLIRRLSQTRLLIISCVVDTTGQYLTKSRLSISVKCWPWVVEMSTQIRTSTVDLCWSQIIIDETRHIIRRALVVSTVEQLDP